MNKQRSAMGQWLSILFLLMPLSVAAETADVEPPEFDYGEVMVGSYMTMDFTITSTAPTPLLVQSIAVVYGTNGFFLGACSSSAAAWAWGRARFAGTIPTHTSTW